MKVKDLLNVAYAKVQLYREDKSLIDKRGYINIGEVCYLHEMSKELLELEVSLIFADNNLLQIKVIE